MMAARRRGRGLACATASAWARRGDRGSVRRRFNPLVAGWGSPGGRVAWDWDQDRQDRVVGWWVGLLQRRCGDKNDDLKDILKDEIIVRGAVLPKLLRGSKGVGYHKVTDLFIVPSVFTTLHG